MKRITFINCIIVSTFIVLSISASAEREGKHIGRSRATWHGGNIRHFELRDRPIWREGHWSHVSYGGRFGWWWVVGPSWYFYSRPIYPYPDPYVPPTVIVTPQTSPTPAPSTQYWYFCEASKEYYPYTSTCPNGWKTVPASPAPEAPPTSHKDK